MCCFTELPKVKGPTLAKTGDSIKFVCEYRGRQTIAWYKDKVRIPQPNAQKKNTTIGNAKTRIPYGTKQVLKLELANVQPSARGEYSCGATFDNSITAYRTILFDIFGKSYVVKFRFSPTENNFDIMEI